MVLLIVTKSFDKGVWVQAEIKTRVFKQKGGLLASDVAIQIANEHGLTPIVETTKYKKSRWVQANMTDLEFLKHIAKNQKAADSTKTSTYIMYTTDKELHFEPVDVNKAPSFTFTYFPNGDGTLFSFEPKIEQKKKDPAVTVGKIKATNSTTKMTSLGLSEPGDVPSDSTDTVASEDSRNTETPEDQGYTVNGDTGSVTENG